MDAVEALRRHALFEEHGADARDFGAAADEAEVAQIARCERAHRLEIALVSARDDHDVGGRRNLGAMQPVGDGLDDDVVGAGKALAVSEFFAVVDDVHAKVNRVGEAGEVPPDVTGADDVQARRGLERIDVDVHLSSADEAVLLREVVVELEVHEHLSARVEDFSRLEAGFVLVAAAADRADRAAIRKHQHLGAGALRR